jgi:hypothetical protein
MYQIIPIRHSIMVHLKFTKRKGVCAYHGSVQPEAHRSSKAKDKATSIHIWKVIPISSPVAVFGRVIHRGNRINSVLMVKLLVVIDCLDVPISALLQASAPLLLRALGNH